MSRWMKLCAGWMLAMLVAGCPVEEGTVEDASVADALRPDAPVCLCDDGIACTLDACDETGACVHEGNCGDGWCAALPDGNTRCETRSCARESDCREDLPCAELVGCVDGFCRYDWAVDRDRDGELDRGCGGNDCAPLSSDRPMTETCNNYDDDCDGEIDNGVDVLSDTQNCGRCGRICYTGACVNGECGCEAGLTLCGGGCVDTQVSGSSCGSCAHVCPLGLCQGGVCIGEPSAHGVDRLAYLRENARPTLDVSSNGDSLIEVVLRPTVLMHYGRASERIPDAASPFPLHAVRLDRDGNLVSVTSLPNLRAERMLAINDAGFYFAGTTTAEITLRGVDYLPGVVLVGFVPRTTGEIAWVHTLTGINVTATHALPSGPLAMVVNTRMGQVLRLVGLDGVVVTLPAPLDATLYNSARTIIGTSEGGFVVAPTAGNDALPTSGPMTTTVGFAIRHSALGLRQEAVRIGDTHLLTERADGNAWLVEDGRSVIEFTRTTQSELYRFAGISPPWNRVDVAHYEGSGYLIGPGASRMRGSRSVEYIGAGAGLHFEDDAVWGVNTAAEPSPFLVDARAVVSRFALRPFP